MLLQGCAQMPASPAVSHTRPHTVEASTQVNRWACDGTLAAQVWRRWEDAGHAYAQQVLQSRLLEQGDTYVLYDLQTLFHNLQAMAVRCNNVAFQRQWATLVAQAYARLEPDASGSDRRQWVCRGGIICNRVNRLIDTEVMLTSVQFLALATDVANTLHARADASAEDHAFARQTARIAVEHLLRWGDNRALQLLRDSMAATRADVADGSSRYFLTDKVLWQLTLYAHVAGMVQRDPTLRSELRLTAAQWGQLRAHANALAALVNKRTVRTTVPTGGATPQVALDLDTGFWRHYKDNRYAAYDGAEKPAVCEPDADGRLRAVIRLKPDTVPIRADIGWDLSHARRLVHYLSAMQRNRVAVAAVWQVPESLLPNDSTVQGFAWQLFTRVWNQDSQRPLFANYFSGANGWYRVAYDIGTARCMEGYPPHGLTDAFPTGGYATWGPWLPQMHTLAARVYDLTQSADPDDRAFVERYYPGLGAKAQSNVQMVQQLMFWPTLVGTNHRERL